MQISDWCANKHKEIAESFVEGIINNHKSIEECREPVEEPTRVSVRTKYISRDQKISASYYGLDEIGQALYN